MKMNRRQFMFFLAPSLALMFLLMAVPLLFTLFTSLTNFTFGSDMEFAGFKNFVEVLGTERFWSAMGFSMFLAVFTTLVKLVLGLLLALLLCRISSKFIRGPVMAALTMPMVVPPVVGTMIFSWLFKDAWGYYTYLLSLINVKISWFETPLAAQSLVTMHWIWTSVPFAMLVLFAGLQAMPKDPFEAAIVDGASPFQRLRYITIPHLTPLFLTVATIDVMDGYRLFDSIAVMTQGGPGGSTETLMYYNYRIAFAQQNLGRGSAITVLTILGIFLLLIPLIIMTYRDQMQGSRY